MNKDSLHYFKNETLAQAMKRKEYQEKLEQRELHLKMIGVKGRLSKELGYQFKTLTDDSEIYLMTPYPEEPYLIFHVNITFDAAAHRIIMFTRDTSKQHSRVYHDLIYVNGVDGIVAEVRKLIPVIKDPTLATTSSVKDLNKKAPVLFTYDQASKA